MAAPLPKTAWQETVTRKLFHRPVWMSQAECLGHPNPNIFFPEYRGAQTYYNQARKVCAVCPVWKECLRYALDTPELEGMWGGLSIVERRKVRHSDGVRKCNKCGFIRVFTQKAQIICDHCNSTKRKKRG